MQRRRARPPLCDFSNQQQSIPSSIASSATSICTSATPRNPKIPSATFACIEKSDVSSTPSPAMGQGAVQASSYMEVDANVSTPYVKVSGKQVSPLVTYSRRKSASHGTMSCPPQCHRRDRGTDDDWNKRSHVKRGFSAMIFNGDDNNMEVAFSKKIRRRSLPNMPKWLPKDFVSEQTCHFAEVDAFQLVEEEGDLSEEED